MQNHFRCANLESFSKKEFPLKQALNENRHHHQNNKKKLNTNDQTCFYKSHLNHFEVVVTKITHNRPNINNHQMRSAFTKAIL